MCHRNVGLTKTYNLFNNHANNDADIVRLRDLHAEMDRAVLDCYGWSDLDPSHGFHQNERGQTRFTISAEARREILRRLLELNLDIAAHEEAELKPSADEAPCLAPHPTPHSTPTVARPDRRLSRPP